MSATTMAAVNTNTNTTFVMNTTNMNNEPGPDIPIFLRKTYAMVNSCDPSICGWDEPDGTTFTVKDPTKFETTIIPQYFKHNKFSSFVRQLNFYSFRKIKVCDFIRIDLETEKKLANHWRFKHEHFQRNRPDQLKFIKRMVSSSKQTTSAATAAPPKPFAVASSSSSNLTNTTQTPTPLAAEKTEVLTLKKRIDEMSKNMNALTEMVQQMNLKQDLPDLKRKKLDGNSNSGSIIMPPPQPEAVLSDATATAMDLDDLILAPPSPPRMMPPDVAASSSTAAASAAVPQAMPLSRDSSSSTDNEFVDQLFSAFNEDGTAAFDFLDETAASTTAEQQSSSSNTNTYNTPPDPVLMQRLSDALALLPKETQELIVNRLIAAITSADGIQAVATGTSCGLATTTVPAVEQKKVAASGKAAIPVTMEEQQQQPTMPLAAATLAALLHHYTTQVKKEQQGNSNSSNSSGGASKASNKKELKSIPVIPVHA